MALEYQFHVMLCTPWDYASRYISENTVCTFCVDLDSQLCHKVFLLSEFPRDENVWLNSDVAKHRLEVFTLMPQLHMPINSLDVSRNRVVCGCDNEAVYVFKNVVL
jgi:hypothetical protein